MRRLPHHHSRRKFLALVGAGMVAMAAGSGRGLAQYRDRQAPHDGPVYREFSSSDLPGWRVTLGDGIYAAPGEAPVSIEDIQTQHDGTLSELHANIRRRRVMAHNITHRRERDDLALDCDHIFTCAFRLSYMSSVDNVDENGQTMDAGVCVGRRQHDDGLGGWRFNGD